LEIGEKGKGLIDNKAAAGLKHLLGISNPGSRSQRRPQP